MRRTLSWMLLGCLTAQAAAAADLGVAAKKLVIVDKLVAAGKAKAVFVASDPAVTKGSGTDPTTINLQLSVDYQGETGPASGVFAVPAGGSIWLNIAKSGTGVVVPVSQISVRLRRGEFTGN